MCSVGLIVYEECRQAARAIGRVEPPSAVRKDTMHLGKCRSERYRGEHGQTRTPSDRSEMNYTRGFPYCYAFGIVNDRHSPSWWLSDVRAPENDCLASKCICGVRIRRQESYTYGTGKDEFQSHGDYATVVNQFCQRRLASTVLCSIESYQEHYGLDLSQDRCRYKKNIRVTRTPYIYFKWLALRSSNCLRAPRSF